MYRQQATGYTDPYLVYQGGLHNTLGQRMSRLIGSALSFSKTFDNHLGAIKYFICRYHLISVAV
ncbi:hypothetical protein C2W62_38060 [Candidatus Entotheonella serta]|nr:hypothetical protein C2W62_38060 [Candidatus Entotheonella serta]